MHVHPQEKQTYLSRCTHNDITLLQQPQIRTRLPRQTHNLLPALHTSKLLLPFFNPQIDHILIRLNAHRPLGLLLTPQPQQREFRADGLTGPGRSADEDIIVCCIQGLEDLGLDLVEGLDGGRVERFEFLVVKRREGERLEVEERSRSWEFIRQDKVFEGDGQPCFSMQPPIRNHGDVVVGRNGFEHGDGESDVMFVGGVALAEHEHVVEEDDFAVDIFDENMEGFGASVNFGVPLEIGRD